MIHVRRYIFRGLVVILLSFGSIALLFKIILIPPPSISELQEEFKNKGANLISSSLLLPEGRLHFLEVGKNTLPTLVLIHGSPGEVSVWKRTILENALFLKFRILIIDRPGYGKSSLKGGSLSYQSKKMATFIEEKCNSCVVMGHSYGGALALQLGADYPKKIRKVISLAGTVSAKYQSPKWYNYWASNRLINMILPQPFRISNDEMIKLPSDLSALKDRTKGLSIPIIFFQGGTDFLVDPLSPFEWLKTLDNVTVVYGAEKDHFIIWNSVNWVSSVLN